jgi:hypothetical protein
MVPEGTKSGASWIDRFNRSWLPRIGIYPLAKISAGVKAAVSVWVRWRWVSLAANSKDAPCLQALSLNIGPSGVEQRSVTRIEHGVCGRCSCLVRLAGRTLDGDCAWV